MALRPSRRIIFSKRHPLMDGIPFDAAALRGGMAIHGSAAIHATALHSCAAASCLRPCLLASPPYRTRGAPQQAGRQLVCRASRMFAHSAASIRPQRSCCFITPKNNHILDKPTDSPQPGRISRLQIPAARCICTFGCSPHLASVPFTSAVCSLDTPVTRSQHRTLCICRPNLPMCCSAFR